MENQQDPVVSDIHQKAFQQKQRLSYIEGWVSIVVNIVLFGLKYWAGIVSGSVAVMADAWHTLSDSLTSVVVLLGTKVSGKSPDEDHPFGHGRAELIASIVIGVLLAVVGFNFLVESVSKLLNRETALYSNLVVIVFIASVILKEGLAQFAIRAAKKVDSKSLKADGWHHRSDAIASAIIIAGVFAGRYFWWVDGVLGILVAFLILYATYEILMQSIDPLIGEKPDSQLLKELHRIVSSIIMTDVNIHRVHLHRYGSRTELTFHIKFLTDVTFKTAHKNVSEIERLLKQTMNINATIHYEPEDEEEQ